MVKVALRIWCGTWNSNLKSYLWKRTTFIVSSKGKLKGHREQNLPGKLVQQSALCWNSLGLFRDYSLNNIFFRNKTVLVFKIESCNFQHLFEKEFRETSQNFNSFSSFRQFLFSFFLSVVWLSWNFVRFHEILFQTDAESFSFLSWKTKKFYSLKKSFLSRTAKVDPKDGVSSPNFQWRFW